MSETNEMFALKEKTVSRTFNEQQEMCEKLAMQDELWLFLELFWKTNEVSFFFKKHHKVVVLMEKNGMKKRFCFPIFKKSVFILNYNNSCENNANWVSLCFGFHVFTSILLRNDLNNFQNLLFFLLFAHIYVGPDRKTLNMCGQETHCGVDPPHTFALRLRVNVVVSGGL